MDLCAASLLGGIVAEDGLSILSKPCLEQSQNNGNNWSLVLYGLPSVGGPD